MLYTTITVKDKEYKCRLSSKSCVDLERKLKTNPVNILLDLEQGKFPPIGQSLMILHASLNELNHGITEEDVFNLYDSYIEEGHSYVDLINNVLVRIMIDAGLLPNDDEAKKIMEQNEKN